MSFVRDSEIYITRRIVRALSLVCLVLSDEAARVTPEQLSEKYIMAGLESEHPGIFTVVDECEAAYEQLKQENKKRVEAWRRKEK